MHVRRSSVLFLLFLIIIIVVLTMYKPLPMFGETPKTPDNTVRHECLRPGYGELNTHSLQLDKRKLTVSEGGHFVVSGNITGREYHVGKAGGSESTCYYDGRVVLKAYLGPEDSKDSWSYMQGKLEGVEGLKIKIIPQEFLLKPNETIDFRVEVNVQKTGTYYLYIVALGGRGWKSWDVVEIDEKT